MKKTIIASAFLLFTGYLSAQQSEKNPATDKDLMTWYHKDYSTTKIYGINTQNAYKFLESKGLKPKTVVVGVLDSGVEVNHPGLKNNLWINPNEIPGNGKDDDKNGYIDDIHGWNFLGNKKGNVSVDNLEVTRTVRKFQPIFEGENSTTNKANQAKMPEEFADYMKAKEEIAEKGKNAKQNFQTYKMVDQAIPTAIALLKGKPLTADAVSGITPTTQQEAIGQKILENFSQDAQAQGKSGESLQQYMKEQIKEALDYFDNQANYHYNLNFDPRAEFVGDNYDDYSEKFYGNNDYEGPDAMHGTHVSGIIAGTPNNKEIQYGVAYKVAKIMSVRTVPNGDERDKDVANAIRYAVDNGAKIINMSFGKSQSPGKKYVWDAFQYAKDKGVLLVKAAGNDNENIQENKYYPTNYKNTNDPAPFINNMIVVGASTIEPEFLRADFSNYNGKMVDVFAPGKEIYSTIPDAKYKYEQGTSMASPVVAGAAAVLLAYMPNLKPEQIIESLVKTANTSTVNAMLSTNVDNRFDLISRAGGVIDLRKAAEYAYKNFYKSDSPAKTIKSKYSPKRKQKTK